jgi:hypothetical protein
MSDHLCRCPFYSQGGSLAILPIARRSRASIIPCPLFLKATPQYRLTEHPRLAIRGGLERAYFALNFLTRLFCGRWQNQLLDDFGFAAAMPIRKYVHKSVFDPETTKAMGEAFTTVLTHLSELGRTQPCKETVASYIVSHAQNGEREAQPNAAMPF